MLLLHVLKWSMSIRWMIWTHGPLNTSLSFNQSLLCLESRSSVIHLFTVVRLCGGLKNHIEPQLHYFSFTMVSRPIETYCMEMYNSFLCLL